MGALCSAPLSPGVAPLSPQATKKYLELSDDVLTRVQFFLAANEQCSNAAVSKAYRRRSRIVFAHSMTAPLSWLHLDSRGVPTLLTGLETQLLAHRGQHVEGIFRHSTESRALQSATRVLERGEALTMSSVDAFSGDAQAFAHCCAALIKMWFRNRHPSLLGVTVSPEDIDRVASLVKSHEMIMGGAQTSQDTKDADIPAEEAVSAIISTLPLNTKQVLLWILDLLAGPVLDAEVDNKMSAWNLAIIFSPTLYNEMDQTVGQQWQDTLSQLRHCRNAAKFMLVAITWRRKEIKKT